MVVVDTLLPCEIDPIHTDLVRDVFDPLETATTEQLEGFIDEVFPAERALGQVALATVLVRETFITIPSTEEELVERVAPLGAAEVARESLWELSQETNAQIDAALEKTKHVRPEKRMLATADIFAHEAYAGKKRLTGFDYVTHPRRAAAVGLHVFERLEEKGHAIDPEFKEATLALMLLHDASEETRGSKKFDPSRQGHFTPLLVHRLLSHPEFEGKYDDYARDTADALRFMTHLKWQPWMPDYQGYLLRGTQDFMFCIGKSTDIFDNAIVEPKPMPEEPEKRPAAEAKWNEKLSIYKGGMRFLKFNAAHTAKGHQDFAWAKRWFEIIDEIDPETVRGPVVDKLDAYIYGKAV